MPHQPSSHVEITIVDAKKPNRPLCLLGALCIAYLAGATLGGYTLAHLALWCLAIPLGVLTAAAARDTNSRT